MAHWRSLPLSSSQCPLLWLSILCTRAFTASSAPCSLVLRPREARGDWSLDWSLTPAEVINLSSWFWIQHSGQCKHAAITLGRMPNTVPGDGLSLSVGTHTGWCMLDVLGNGCQQGGCHKPQPESSLWDKPGSLLSSCLHRLNCLGLCCLFFCLFSFYVCLHVAPAILRSRILAMLFILWGMENKSSYILSWTLHTLVPFSWLSGLLAED